MNKPTRNEYPIAPALQQRWSPRAFDAKRPLERHQLLSLLEAARWSPSSNNSQPWRFIVAERRNEVAFHTMVSVLAEGNQRWAKDAGALILMAARTLRDDGRVNRYGAHDAGIALACLTVQAIEMGLFVHPMAGFDAQKARAIYAIPDAYEPITVSAVGYYGALEQLDDDLRNRELQPRERLPLSELVYEGRFGHVAEFVRPAASSMEKPL
ncbi:nitroreductase family protein [Aggregatilineales bacterium SYSU G02658]